MRNTEYDHSVASYCTAADYAAVNTLARMFVSHETPLHEATRNDLSALAAVLVKAARTAREGDSKAATAHIAHAVELLQRSPISALSYPLTAAGQRRATPARLLAWQVRRLIEHVEANFAQRICVAELAALVDLSTSHFSRAFKCTFGVSPHIYVLRRRVEAAQALMLTTNEPLSSIALSCGMCDQAHLTRRFNRIVGETPHLWRRSRKSRRGELLSVEMQRRCGGHASLT